MSDALELAEVPALFERWLAGGPLVERSRREYARNVRVYCAWVVETPDRDGWQGDLLTDRLTARSERPSQARLSRKAARRAFGAPGCVPWRRARVSRAGR